MSTENALHGPEASLVDPAVCEIRFQDDGLLNAFESQMKSDEDSTGRCSHMTLVLGSVPLGFNHSVKIQILSCAVVVNGLCLLLARLCKRPS